ncbi:MAG: hypothetical protein WKG52_10725 [Variovorax sp.]
MPNIHEAVAAHNINTHEYTSTRPGMARRRTTGAEEAGEPIAPASVAASRWTAAGADTCRIWAGGASTAWARATAAAASRCSSLIS